MRWRKRSRGPVSPEPPTGAHEAAATSTSDPVNPRYVLEPPSPQTQLDLFAGEWTSQVPDVGGATSGPRPELFDDERIAWAIDRLGPISGWQVLELGPLEAGHTTMLERAGAEVVAVEAHDRAFQRCLVVKNLLGLRARFELGDFVAYLRDGEHRFDLIVACGVLYHLVDPVEALRLIGRRTDRLALWTHYYDAEVNARRPDVADRFSGETRTLDAPGGDGPVTGHVYEYREGVGMATFCGGARPTASWIARDDLLRVLRAVGLSNIEIQFDDPDSAHGPSISLVASR